MQKSIIELVKEFDYPKWSKYEGCSQQMIVEVENEFGYSLPSDYRELMRYTNASTLYGPKSVINMEPIDYIIGHNINEFFMQYIPGMLVFADDTSEGIYYYDPKGVLGKGEFAIFYVFSGSLGLENSVYLASSLFELFEKLLSGDDFIEMFLNK